jgi:formamidopyrimidine-DNA glycosylase
MPELPEVETVTRFINREAKGETFSKITFYRQQLREAIPIAPFKKVLLGQPITQVFRRSKYILMESPQGFGLFHLGMTGNVLWLKDDKPIKPHTHLIMELKARAGRAPRYLHFIDPRRFGQIHAWEGSDWENHPYIQLLGPEPLDIRDLGGHLFKMSRKRSVNVKTFIMNGRIVVGVGNIYACEALFSAGIHPETPAGKLEEGDYRRLARCIRATLRRAIEAGGTTFRDFKDSEGKPGYFAQALKVYGREGEACVECGGLIKRLVQTGRSTWFCGKCQN